MCTLVLQYVCLLCYVCVQEVLDADDTPLKNRRGELMKRDIVQFVPFRQLSSQSGTNFSLVREKSSVCVCVCVCVCAHSGHNARH